MAMMQLKKEKGAEKIRSWGFFKGLFLTPDLRDGYIVKMHSHTQDHRADLEPVPGDENDIIDPRQTHQHLVSHNQTRTLRIKEVPRIKSRAASVH